ncbi:MAG: hypothetical protein IJ958_04425 [Agathobacter sp.]|nr:hypothetical protein [Agathobacter sp.]
MERKEQLCRAIKKIGWGYVFLYFNINLGTINIMPAWIGYILFYQAIRDGISQEEESAGLLKTIGIILGIYNGITWLLSMIAIPAEIFLISEVISVISLYYHFQLLTNLANIAKRYQCFQEEKALLHLRTWQTILLTILAFMVQIEALYEWSLVLVFVQCIIMVCICVYLRKLKHALEDLPDIIFTSKEYIC